MGVAAWGKVRAWAWLALVLWGEHGEAAAPRDGALAVARERRQLVQLARHARPAVVALFTESGEEGSPDVHKGLGSGFFIHRDGYLLTSQHVVQGAARVRVQPAPETGLPEAMASVVGEDEETDTALLKVDLGRPVPVLRLGPSAPVQVADWVMVIGNPFGLPHSVSLGIVSFKGRTGVHPGGRVGDFEFLQTDAAINPGSSGGPVMDLAGDVVAMANAVNVSGQGIAFAQPSEAVAAALTRLWPEPVPRGSWLGVHVREGRQGVEVAHVLPRSPAELAGLRPGDLITAVDGWEATALRALASRLALSLPGARAALQVVRDGRPLVLHVRSGTPPATSDAALRPPSGSAM